MLAGLGSDQKWKMAASWFVTSHQRRQLFGCTFDCEIACTAEQMIGKERRGLSEGRQGWVGHSTNKEYHRSLRHQLKTQRTAGHSEKANYMFLNGLSCWFSKSGFGWGGRSSFGFARLLNFNKRASFSGWITLTFFPNYTETNMPTNSHKPNQVTATLTIIDAIQRNTQTWTSQGQGLHMEKCEPTAGFRANFKIAHMEENCNHLKTLTGSKQELSPPPGPQTLLRRKWDLSVAADHFPTAGFN